MNKSNDCQQQVGKVIKIKKSVAYVERVSAEACNGCNACVIGREGDKLILPANNDIGAKIGDSVIFSPPKPRPFLAILMLFVLPLSVMITGLVLALYVGLSEAYSVIISLCCAAVSFIVVLLLDKLIFSKKNATVIKILIQNKEGENND